MLSTNEQAQDKRSIFLGVFHAEIVSNIGFGLGLGLGYNSFIVGLKVWVSMQKSTADATTFQENKSHVISEY